MMCGERVVEKEREMKRLEAGLVRREDEPYNEKVEEWLRGGGERE